MFLAPLALVVALSITDAAVIDATLTRWEAAARDLKWLHVEYTRSEADIGQRVNKYAVKLRILRTDDGLFADLSGQAGDTPGDRLLLRDGAVHLLNETQKVVTRFPTDDTTRFLADHFHPFVVLLDRERALTAYAIKVEKQDDWFVHLSLTPKDGKASRSPGVIVVPHRKNDTLPVGLPCSVHTRDAFQSEEWTVSKWVMNGNTPPKAEEFARPSEKDGWTISEWTWPPKWKTK